MNSIHKSSQIQSRVILLKMKTKAGLCKESKRQKLQNSALFGTWYQTDDRHQNTVTPTSFFQLSFSRRPGPAPIHCLWKIKEQGILFIESVKQRKCYAFFLSSKNRKITTQSYLSTRRIQNSSNPILVAFWREKMFQHLALARDSLHFLELVWVTTPPCKRKCFTTRLLLGICWFWHSLQVLERWAPRYHCTLLC